MKSGMDRAAIEQIEENLFDLEDAMERLTEEKASIEGLLAIRETLTPAQCSAFDAWCKAEAERLRKVYFSKTDEKPEDEHIRRAIRGQLAEAEFMAKKERHLEDELARVMRDINTISQQIIEIKTQLKEA